MNDLQTLEKLSTMDEAITNYGFTAVDAKIDTQVLIQLLIKKGIITKQEVITMREVVKKNTAYGDIYDASSELIVYLAEKRKTADALKRLVKGGKDALTQEELDQLGSTLNEIINGDNHETE